MIYVPSIKWQKRTRVCVFLYESGLHCSSIEHLLFGEMAFISNRSSVLPPSAKASLGWVVNLFPLSWREEMPMTLWPELRQGLDGWQLRAPRAVEAVPVLGAAAGPSPGSALCAVCIAAASTKTPRKCQWGLWSWCQHTLGSHKYCSYR